MKKGGKAPEPKGKSGANDTPCDYPVNTVSFNLCLTVKQEGGHNMRVKYDWFSEAKDQSKGALEWAEQDAAQFRDWNTLEIEGEEPIPQEAPVEEAPKPAAKGKAPAKGAKVVQEEIVDNRPRTQQYKKDWMADAGAGTRFSEQVAQGFEHAVLQLRIYSADDKLAETIKIDLSFLLFPNTSNQEYEWTYDKMLTQQIHWLKIGVQVDQPLLSQYLRKKLNPLQVTLSAIKDIPFKREPQYKPIYAKCSFVDGREFITHEMPQQPHCKFNHRHVFLVGNNDYAQLREDIATKFLNVQLHDNDEYVKAEQNSDEIFFSVGNAKITFRDFLNPHCKSLKLRADVFPSKKLTFDNTTNIDLNTTARKNEKTVDKFNPYFTHNTYVVIQANLAYPIKPSSQVLTPGKEAEAHTASQVSMPSKGKPSSRPPTNLTNERPSERVQSMNGEEFDQNGAIYERMIIVLPYRGSKEAVLNIQNCFEKINLKGLGLENTRYLNTKELNEEERANRTLDFLGGFELMDSEMRIFVFEGLGGEGNSMSQFYEANKLTKPNDKKFKLVYNPEIKFKHRLYLDFNCAIKKIKLREPLSEIVANPNIYLRSKVPEEMYKIMQQFGDLRKLERASMVRDFDVFPSFDNLVTLERKYGDGINFEDMNGFRKKKAKKSTHQPTSNAASDIVGDIMSDGKSQGTALVAETVQSQSMCDVTSVDKSRISQGDVIKLAETHDSDEDDMPRSPVKTTKIARKGPTVHRNADFARSIEQRLQEDQFDFKGRNVGRIKSMSSGRPLAQRIDLPKGIEAYGYSGQRLNIWDFQKDTLRKQIANDQGSFYTYSKHHLSLAFPLVNEHEIASKAKEDNENKWKTKAGFIKPRVENFNAHPKAPPQSVIDAIRTVPYHKEREHTERMTKKTNNIPKGEDYVDFYSKVKGVDTFGDRDFFKTVFAGGDDVLAELAQLKQKEIDDWRQKVVVNNPNFTVNLRPKHSQQTDKYKDICEEEPQKIGLRLNMRKMRHLTKRQINVERKTPLPPVNLFCAEEWVHGERFHKDQTKLVPDFSKTPFRKDGTKVDVQFNRYARQDISNESPLSKKQFIQPLAKSERAGIKWGPSV